MNRFLLITAVIFLISCSKSREGDARWHDTITDEKTGDVIALWIIRNWGGEIPKDVDTITVELEYDYGMITIWNDRERLFCLYDNVKKKAFETRDFDVFIRELNKLPENITIRRLVGCQSGFSYFMPDKEKKKIEATLSKGNRKTESPFITNLCGSTAIVFPLQVRR